ncbi:putative transcriptional regulator [Bacillus sp. TS-2]|nr:putative transcriptional regulator [Bacillus sp. TS-2]
MRITKDSDNRKKEIMDAAELLFVTKGYTQTTVNNILQEVGIAKGTFYHHFQSKEEVMDAIVNRFIKHAVDSAQNIANTHDLSAPEKLLYIFMPNQENQHKKEVAEQFHTVNNAEMHQKSIVETIIQLTPIITTIIEQGIKEGHFSTPFPKETVEFLLVSSQFLFDEGIFEWTPEEQMNKAIAFSHIIETTLGAKKGTFDFIKDVLTGSTEND